MWYEEKLIDGVWFYRTQPRGKWRELPIEKMAERITKQKAEIDRLTALVEKQWQPITSIDQLESGRWYWYRREHPSWKSRFEAVRCTLPSGRKRLGPWWATQDNNQAIGDFAECYGPIQPPTQQDGE